MKCKCGNKCIATGSPKTVMNFKIPFTQIEVMAWNWGKPEYHETCEECDKEKEAYDSGFNDGAMEAATEILNN